ncbi:MAG: Unknown protein [uncultured Thiotrichaceae bacterium]|uniref:VWFA domain-containing protein n=1 Tax=uncultured Thiotrichaceae bacterium TaxID=298394 RepID=A0A6S6T5B1_9GAMM|nr:MAG: Unknown protein [uncultured Thiotrichaceae bacterium]
MSWREPLWLLLCLFPVVMLLWQKFRLRSQAHHYADPELLPWVQVQRTGWRRWLRTVFWSAFWILMAITLAGPQLPLKLPQAKAAVEQDIYVLVDVSRSMQVEDVLPNRLARARIELHEFANLIDKSRLSVTVYASRPHVLVPLTSDIAAADFYLQQLESLILPTLGGDSVLALKFLDELIAKREDTSAPASIYWLTDGDFKEQKIAVEEQVDVLKKKNIPLNIIGIGQEDGGSIPLAEGGWVQEHGLIVRSQLNARLLAQLAERGGGRYTTAKRDYSDWQALYLSQQTNELAEVPDQAEKHWKQLYQWSLFPALVLFFLLISMPRKWLPVILLLALPIPPPSFAEGEMQLGEQAYRAEAFDEAVKQYTKAVIQADSEEARGRALHNLGNSYFQQGEYLSAVQVFQDALTYRAGHKPTLHNLAVAQKVLEQLRQQLQRQQQRVARSNQQGQDNGGGFGVGQPQGSGNNQGENAGTEIGQELGGNQSALDGQQDPTRSWGSGFGQDLVLPEVPVPQEELESLVGVGLKRLSLRGINSMQEWQSRNQSLYEARLVLQKMESSSEKMWKRLFEIEEGFPGSLDAPKEVPGLLSW